jgi:RNA polymerase sigma-70 factor (ECF subfamily)
VSEPLTGSGSSAALAAVSQAARRDGGRLVALLAGQFRDLDLADESVQDALEEAVRTWPERGVPDNPAGWLLTVARRKAIDRTRRAASAQRRTLAAAPELLAEPSAELERPEDEAPMTLDHAGIRDDQLRLILLCCHPALDRDAQVALTLRLVGGLTTPEIAAAYLVPEATLAQRIVRAKRKIKAAKIPLTIPAELEDRVETVLRVLYLIFNEGYLSHAETAALVRSDLVDEAVRLTALMVDLAPDSPECKGLLALELFHRARSRTRADPDGELILLEDQDRSRWDLAEIRLANRVLHDALSQGHDGAFQLQALIAGCHANARLASETNWPAIVSAYDRLIALTPSPIVALNRAVAVAMADGPQLGLTLLDQIEGLESYHLFHAARAELMLRAGDRDEAAVAFRRARQLATNPAEQRHLDRRLRATRL